MNTQVCTDGIDFPDSDCECDEDDCKHDSGSSNSSSDRLILFKFYCRDCQACDHMCEPFKEMSRRFKTITFMEVDLEDNKEAMKNLKIKKLPTFVAFNKDKQEVARHVSLDPYSLYQFIHDLHAKF